MLPRRIIADIVKPQVRKSRIRVSCQKLDAIGQPRGYEVRVSVQGSESADSLRLSLGLCCLLRQKRSGVEESLRSPQISQITQNRAWGSEFPRPLRERVRVRGELALELGLSVQAVANRNRLMKWRIGKSWP